VRNVELFVCDDIRVGHHGTQADRRLQELSHQAQLVRNRQGPKIQRTVELGGVEEQTSGICEVGLKHPVLLEGQVRELDVASEVH
jgi:hypothetical protein